MPVTVKTALNKNLIEFTIIEDSDTNIHVEDGVSEKLVQVRSLLEHSLVKWNCVKFHVIFHADFKVKIRYVGNQSSNANIVSNVTNFIKHYFYYYFHISYH